MQPSKLAELRRMVEIMQRGGSKWEDSQFLDERINASLRANAPILLDVCEAAAAYVHSMENRDWEMLVARFNALRAALGKLGSNG